MDKGVSGVSEVEETMSIMAREWDAGNLDAVLRGYAPDIRLMSQGGEAIIEGHDALRAEFMHLMNSKVRVEFELVCSRALGADVVESWTRTIIGDPIAPSLLLRSLLVWQRREGVWVIVSEATTEGPF